MNDDPVPANDAVDAFLAARFPAAAEHLQQPLRQQTTALLRRRKWQRRLILTAALAACFGAGLVTQHLLRPLPTAPSREGSTSRPVQTALTKPPPAPGELVSAVKGASQPALALEWLALESPDRGAELYRQAGDRYVQDHQDWQSALRCYRGALHASATPDLTIDPTDSWLVMVLKDARRKEKSHAKNGL